MVKIIFQNINVCMHYTCTITSWWLNSSMCITCQSGWENRSKDIGMQRGNNLLISKTKLDRVNIAQELSGTYNKSFVVNKAAWNRLPLSPPVILHNSISIGLTGLLSSCWNKSGILNGKPAPWSLKHLWNFPSVTQDE